MIIQKVIGTTFMPEISIDQNDYFDFFIKHNWHFVKAKQTIYLQANGKRSKMEPKVLHLHRLIMQPNKGQFIDHKDGNGLNNKRDNLRIATITQNNWNKKIHHSNKSGFKGVTLHECGRYRVCIFKDGKQIQGGYFDDIFEAAKKYNELALKHFGEFSRLNIIPNQ